MMNQQMRKSVLSTLQRRCFATRYDSEIFATGMYSSGSGMEVNGKKYKFPRGRKPVVGICIDGCSQDYIDAAVLAGVMPNYSKMVEKDENTRKSQGVSGLVTTAMPTFTNPNNVGIMTGVTPDEHGISGNYYYDREADAEVSMTDPKLLTADSIFGKFSQAGVGVTIVTAKDKLRKLLTHTLSDPYDPVGCGSFGFSVEFAGDEEVTKVLQHRGIAKDVQDLMDGKEAPHIYDPDCSIYCLEVGAKLIEKRIGDGESDFPWLYYLSTTDYVQHKHAPGTPEANDFYQKIDNVLGKLDSMGAVVGLTADHGMSSKTGYSGEPKIVFAETLLKEHGIENRTILPITDPYVAHHSSLGSYATIYIDEHDDEEVMMRAMKILRDAPGVYTVMNNEEACKTFQLPSERVGDIVVVGSDNTVIGRTDEYHDLSQVPDLRSHGGLSESVVPMFFNLPLKEDYQQRLGSGRGRNFHLFDFLLNGVKA